MIQEFRLKNIDQTWNYFIEEINQNKLKSFELYWALAYFNFKGKIGLKICVATAGIKKYKSKKKHDKIVLLAKSKLNSIKVLTSKAIINSNIIHDQLAIISNVVKECHVMKEEIKNSSRQIKI